MNIVRCMLADSTLPSLLWGKLMQTAVYLSNRTPHAALHNGTPYKALFGTDAHLGHPRVVGARAFVHEETHTKKLDSRAWEGRLVGYSLDSKSYRIYNAQTRRVRESRNVIFIETTPSPPSLDERGLDSKSYRIYNAQTRRVRESRNVIFIETTPAPPSLDERGFDDGEFTYADHDDMIRDVRNYTTNHSVDALSPTHAVGDPSVLELLEDISTVHNRDLGTNSADPAPAAEDAPADDSLASPGGVSPPEPGDGASSPAASLSAPAPAGSTSSPATPPRASVTPAVALRVVHLRVVGVARVTRAISRVPNKKTLSELRRLSYAFPAMGEFPDVAHRDATLGFTEYAYTVGGVQPDVPRTIQEARASPDATKWNAAAEREMKSLSDRKVYKLVPRSAVPPERKRIKSKWVFKRKADGTFKGRVVAQVEFNLIFDQMDVSTAFLYADIQEEMFVEQPPGFEVKDKDGGNWFNTIDPVLVEIGFVALKSDPCVYLYDHNGAKIYLTLYVDDLLLAGNDSDAISMVKGKLQKRFKMTDLGEASLVLGMEIRRDREANTLTISQEAYCKSILERFGMSGSKPTSTPGYGSEISNNIQPEDTLLDEKETRKYQGIMGSLMYIALVLRYDIMCATGGFKLATFSDSNWANNPDNGKSTSSYLTMLANAPMSFRSGLQGLTAMSTMEAELVASALAMKEAVFCSNMMTELGFGK
ncbi:unnamed protein product [Ectocarpus sp. CCAP 1310/34]|nr:unnamed protein product [Ectocarpus sp. CCAP 1310/34]